MSPVPEALPLTRALFALADAHDTLCAGLLPLAKPSGCGRAAAPPLTVAALCVCQSAAGAGEVALEVDAKGGVPGMGSMVSSSPLVVA